MVAFLAASVESNGRQNLATEFWITSRAPSSTAPDPAIIKAELMIWTQASPGLADPKQKPEGEVLIVNGRGTTWINRLEITVE